MSELSDFLDEALPGPWRPEPPSEDDPHHPSFWLTNDAGDSLLIESETAALLINALLAAERP